MSIRHKLNLAKLAFRMNSTSKVPMPLAPLLPQVIHCYEAILTAADTDFLLRLEPKRTYSYDELRRLSGKVDAVFKPFLERLMSFELVSYYDYRDGREPFYRLNSILVGWFESTLSPMELSPERVEFARRVYKLFTGVKRFNFTPVRQIINFIMWVSPTYRTVVTLNEAAPAKKSISLNKPVEAAGAEGGVMALDGIDYYLDKFDEDASIGVCACFCRQFFTIGGEPCRYEVPTESCIMLGPHARHLIESGLGRSITKTECSEIIKDCYSKGAMLNVLYLHSNMNELESAICLCCPDCCGGIGAYNRGLLPLNVKAYYLAQANVDNCVGCKLCEKFCASGAIKIVNKKIVLDEERCIGCGQCAYHCKKDAVTLIRRERQVFLPNRPKAEARF